MKSNILLLLLLLSSVFTACNKEELGAEKALYVVVNGYNGGTHALEIAIDTTRYTNWQKLAAPSALMGFNTIYTYRQGAREALLTLRDTLTKQIVFSKSLNLSNNQVAINFMYVDGKPSEFTPPAADTATNKLSFYVQHTDSEDPFDMFLYRRDFTTGEEFRHYLAKNIKPGNWVTVNYVAAAGFGTDAFLDQSSIYCTKAGTTDQWAFLEKESHSKMSVSGMYLPINNEKGLVQSYCLLPGGWQLQYARMFFYPGRVK
jgi:hypothetical protein